MREFGWRDSGAREAVAGILVVTAQFSSVLLVQAQSVSDWRASASPRTLAGAVVNYWSGIEGTSPFTLDIETVGGDRRATATAFDSHWEFTLIHPEGRYGEASATAIANATPYVSVGYYAVVGGAVKATASAYSAGDPGNLVAGAGIAEAAIEGVIDIPNLGGAYIVHYLVSWSKVCDCRFGANRIPEPGNFHDVTGGGHILSGRVSAAAGAVHGRGEQEPLSDHSNGFIIVASLNHIPRDIRNPLLPQGGRSGPPSASSSGLISLEVSPEASEVLVPLNPAFGNGEFVYLGFEPHEEHFVVTENYMTAFTLPLEFNGLLQHVELEVEGHAFEVTPGETVDFTAIAPGGIQEFHMSSMNATIPVWDGEENLSVLGIEFAILEPTSIVFQPVPRMPGDYDWNGDVDAADHAVWQAKFGTQVIAHSGADGNGDGAVDAADYVMWRKNLVAARGSAVVEIPEPATPRLISTLAACMAVLRPTILGLRSRSAQRHLRIAPLTTTCSEQTSARQLRAALQWSITRPFLYCER